MSNRTAEHYYLQSQMKSSGMAYVCWVLLGAHYAYLDRWGLQILYWVTFGGFLIWAFIDLFRIPGMVADHNWEVAQEIEAVELKQIRGKNRLS